MYSAGHHVHVASSTNASCTYGRCVQLNTALRGCLPHYRLLGRATKVTVFVQDKSLDMNFFGFGLAAVSWAKNCWGRNRTRDIKGSSLDKTRWLSSKYLFSCQTKRISRFFLIFLLYLFYFLSVCLLFKMFIVVCSVRDFYLFSCFRCYFLSYYYSEQRWLFITKTRNFVHTSLFCVKPTNQLTVFIITFGYTFVMG